MNSHQHPQLWVSPQWHSDHGDPEIELEHLRAFALNLVSAVPDASVALESPEPGLMDVRVELGRGIVAEIYSVPSPEDQSHRRLAIFCCPDTPNESEVYAESIEDAANLFALLSNGDRPGGRDGRGSDSGAGAGVTAVGEKG